MLDAVKNEWPAPPSEVADGVPRAVDEVVPTAMTRPHGWSQTVVHFVEALEIASRRAK